MDTDTGVRVDTSGPVRTLTIDRPEVRNALARGTRLALATELAAADADPSVRVVVLTGAGGHFCSGGDINEFGTIRDEDEAGDYARAYAQPVFRTMRSMRTPTIARVEGTAAGAGMFLALGCDIVVAARDARFIASHLNLGLPPDWGAVWILPRLVGVARAKSILLTRRPVSAVDAVAWGLIAECVEPSRLDTTVERYCEDLVSAPALALGITRQGIDLSIDQSLDAFLQWEALVIGSTLLSEHHHERVRAFQKAHPRARPNGSNSGSSRAPGE